ncbi:hypothetical protein [Saccharothrix texasensis]|uniref:Uncharacterized protein n=1 Tax=Saccharothrix texasensis TaxID=103734 RepID=A0A3N1H1Y2_9PSEU|nr:hypothetical protein [Saccharothrix texasensis]ROP36262.1 hypothetical protein EDD40_1527 [Saccharothrix texasensis]
MDDPVDLPEWLVTVLEAVELLAVVVVFVGLPLTVAVSQAVMACA